MRNMYSLKYVACAKMARSGNTTDQALRRDGQRIVGDKYGCSEFWNTSGKCSSDRTL